MSSHLYSKVGIVNITCMLERSEFVLETAYLYNCVLPKHLPILLTIIWSFYKGYRDYNILLRLSMNNEYL